MLEQAPTKSKLRQARVHNRLLDVATAGWVDIAEGIANWRIWHLIGSADLRQRYVRSRLGQFWLTLSTGILIGSLGLVWSLLWNVPVSEMMPYLAVSIVLWNVFVGIIGDATTVFVKNGRYFINQKMSFATAINGLVYQHALVLLHNAVIVVLVFIFFQKPVGLQALLAIPGLCLAGLTAFWLSYVVAIICTRYRDLGQVVSSILQIAFFVTPVLWKVKFIPEAYRELVLLNPFAIYLSIIRDPILGEPMTLEPWLIAASITVVGFLLTLPLIGRYQSRIVYWL
jgi:ABC-type polysaccharide/polyol phosphate export permease